MCREGWEVGILGCIDHPLFRIGKAKLTKNGDTVLVAGLIEQASAEFEVLSVRPHGRQGQAAPAFFCAVLLGEHLEHVVFAPTARGTRAPQEPVGDCPNREGTPTQKFQCNSQEAGPAPWSPSEVIRLPENPPSRN